MMRRLPAWLKLLPRCSVGKRSDSDHERGWKLCPSWSGKFFDGCQKDCCWWCHFSFLKRSRAL